MIGYYSQEELEQLGFASLGKNIKISKTSTIYNRSNVSIGNNVRIDNFCTLAVSDNSKLVIGNNVQISAYSFMNGMENILLDDFVTFAPFVRVFSSTDDYSGKTLTNATIPQKYLGTISGVVCFKKHTIIGTGTTIMPNVTLEEGTSVAAHSFVNKNSMPFTIIGGVPARFIKKRLLNLKDLEAKFKANEC